MTSPPRSVLPPGWVGGFAQSKPAFAYPNPDLSSLPMLDNLANIDLLQRVQGVEWPEFSWETIKDDPESRCYVMFAPYLSKIGYTNQGRIYSIICPQQGQWIKNEVCLNLEITVTGQRGWVDEADKSLAADMTAEGKVWFSPSEHQNDELKLAWPTLEHFYPNMPLKKKKAIRVVTHAIGDPDQPIFPVRKGESTNFKIPEFARHVDDAWTVGHLAVEIGEIQKTHDPMVDEFGEIVMDAFNLTSANLLRQGNILSWNVWISEPQLVNQEAWRSHARTWRDSIDAHHGSPTGPATPPRHFDGSPFNQEEQLVDEALEKLLNYIKKLMQRHYKP